jgi:hypothetical protein
MTSGDEPTRAGIVAGADFDMTSLNVDDLDDDDVDDDTDDDDAAEIDPELAQAMAAEMAEARARIADTPAEDLIANHAMGFFEIAAINLSASQPSLFDAALAIDAMGAVVEGLGVDRLGQHGPVLADALSQIRMAFVHVKQALTAGEPQSADGAPADS